MVGMVKGLGWGVGGWGERMNLEYHCETRFFGFHQGTNFMRNDVLNIFTIQT